MAISRKEIEHIASLARLDSTGGIFDRLADDMQGIVGMVDKLAAHRGLKLDPELVYTTGNTADLSRGHHRTNRFCLIKNAGSRRWFQSVTYVRAVELHDLPDTFSDRLWCVIFGDGPANAAFTGVPSQDLALFICQCRAVHQRIKQIYRLLIRLPAQSVIAFAFHLFHAVSNRRSVRCYCPNVFQYFADT